VLPGVTLPSAGSAGDNSAAMGLTVAFTELGPPHVAARYTCRCGAVHVKHGRDAGLPEGWVTVGEDETSDDYACPRCARTTGEAGNGPPEPAA
jgi:hypothetical protein